MAQKVIIDTDPGIDDAVALTLALFDPTLEVQAVTATGGNVEPDQATRNVQVVVEQLDPPRWPRFGSALTNSPAGTVHAKHLHGADGLGEADFQAFELHHRHPSDKLIADAVRAEPHELTLLALGPLTNIAGAFRRDPELPKLVKQIVLTGGSVAKGGNVTAAAEFNMYCDPLAAREVLQAPVSVLMIPLDVSEQLIFTFNHFDRLPGAQSRIGRFLRQILPFAFRAFHQHMALEGVHLHDVVALMALLEPKLFRSEPMTCDVETAGELTRGATVFDRRPGRGLQTNVDVALEVDVAAVIDRLWTNLSRAAAG
jgi:inosine-uridine nucleoside N-ribohydrolase